MNKPDPRLKITVDEQEHELLMTIGLKNRLVELMEDPARVGIVAVDAELSRNVVITCLTKKGKSGAIDGPIDYDELSMSENDEEAVLQWAQEHVLDFFTRRFEKMGQLNENLAEMMKGMVPSDDGSQDSATETPSAGASD